MWLERYSLIEVDLMPTLKGEITPILEMWHSHLTDYVVGKLIIPGLDFKLKGGRCDKKEFCILMFGKN